MKLHGKNMTGSILFAGLLVIGMLDIAVSGQNTVKAAETTNAVQTTYTTPEQAGQALRVAVEDEKKLEQVLGPDSTAVVFSGDAAEDKAALTEFAAKYDRMNRWVAMTDGSRVLYIGADNYPYPIPLELNSSSRWYFDTAAGKDEILARRIGQNELLAIDAVYATADAEELYFQSTSRYADKFVSTPSRMDGLYWQVSVDRSASPLIFGGYSFRIVTGKSGYTIVATPVTYGDSGIMSFVLRNGGGVYQKDLGPDSAAIASYNTNDGWTLAE